MKIGIITINEKDNYGNRLQNYAVQEILKNKNFDVETIKNEVKMKTKSKINISLFLKKLNNKMQKIIYKKNINKRVENFQKFNNMYIKTTDFKIDENTNNDSLKEKYDFFVVGSDQVWNPNWRLSNVDLLTFANDNQKIAFSASFGVNDIPDNNKEKTSKELKKFKSISVREDSAKELVENLTGREDIEVLIDPTLMLTTEEWDKIIKKPSQLESKKYILNYFLGGLSKRREKEIKRIAKENNCDIINILDRKSKFYITDPSEFVYLEKNAFLICTDSFHSSVFAILYNRPFIVFERENTKVNMSSRFKTLLSKFNLNNREFTGKITSENLQHDYTKAYEILEKERKKVNDFIKKAFEV